MKKTQLTAAEIAQLTPSEKARYRRIMKAYEEKLNPVRSAQIKLEYKLRMEANQELNIVERIEQVEKPIRGQMAEVEAQIKELNAKWRELSDQLNNVGQDIRLEPWDVAYNDPQVRALRSIWGEINDEHESNLVKFLESTGIEAVA